MSPSNTVRHTHLHDKVSRTLTVEATYQIRDSLVLIDLMLTRKARICALQLEVEIAVFTVAFSMPPSPTRIARAESSRRGHLVVTGSLLLYYEAIDYGAHHHTDERFM